MATEAKPILMTAMDIVDELYEKQVKPLSVPERLQLMRLIVSDLVRSAPQWIVESSDAWSQADLSDLSRASLLYAQGQLPDRDGDDDSG